MEAGADWESGGTENRYGKESTIQDALYPKTPPRAVSQQIEMLNGPNQQAIQQCQELF